MQDEGLPTLYLHQPVRLSLAQSSSARLSLALIGMVWVAGGNTLLYTGTFQTHKTVSYNLVHRSLGLVAMLTRAIHFSSSPHTKADDGFKWDSNTVDSHPCRFCPCWLTRRINIKIIKKINKIKRRFTIGRPALRPSTARPGGCGRVTPEASPLGRTHPQSLTNASSKSLFWATGRRGQLEEFIDWCHFGCNGG